MANQVGVTADDAEITDGAGIATTPTTGGTYAPGAMGGVVVSDSSIGAGQPGGGQVITGGNTTGGQITGGIGSITIGNPSAGGATGSSATPGVPNPPGISQDAILQDDDAGIALDDSVRGDKDGVPTGGLAGE